MFIENQRFRKPITSVECEKFEESWVSDSSRRKWAWVLKVFDQWMVERNDAVNKISYSSEPLINENLDEMSDEQLISSWLDLFPKLEKKTDKNIQERLYMK